MDDGDASTHLTHGLLASFEFRGLRAAPSRPTPSTFARCASYGETSVVTSLSTAQACLAVARATSEGGPTARRRTSSPSWPPRSHFKAIF